MFLLNLNPRAAQPFRIIGLLLVTWSVVTSSQPPSTSGRGLLVLILLVVAFACWALWIVRPGVERPLGPDLYVLAAVGGWLAGATPSSAASAFVFVAVVVSAMRVELATAGRVVAVGILAIGASTLIYNGPGLGLLAYSLGFAATALAASNVRQSMQRAEQAELLLAQGQRSHEEALRAARLEESTRIAREIHDVLAHSLAGLTIQLEATTALIENGAEPDQIVARVRRAHELARDGLRETRRAVGALRGEEVSVPVALGTLAGEDSATLTIAGDESRLRGDVGRAVVRVVQESLTNAAKHAPGSEVTISVDVGEEVVVIVDSRQAGVPVAAGSLSGSGGGYGLAGMRERAEALGGTVQAGPTELGWRVRFCVPSPALGEPRAAHDGGANTGGMAETGGTAEEEST